MNWQREFTRPLMTRCAGHSAALVAILADRAEDHADLARHLLAALHDLKCTCEIDTTGLADPVIIQK